MATVKVSSWSPSPIPASAKLQLGGRRFGSPGWIGVIGSLLIHSLVLPSVLLGARSHTIHELKVQGLGATRIDSEAPPAENLVLIELPMATMNAKPLIEDLASVGSALKHLPVTIISPDPLPYVGIPEDAAAADALAADPVDSGDRAARAALFGRYTGQINARIERAWRRPRTPVTPDGAMAFPAAQRPSGAAAADDIFRCQTRIIQDARGAVQEVQLLSCNGSVAWQDSLIAAILTASPFPAPPSPTVFTREITLTFEGYPYGSGRAEDDYEIEGSNENVAQGLNAM